MLSSGRLTPAEAFPDLFEPDEPPADDSEVEFDYSGVEWESPATVGEEEYDRVMAALRENATITTRAPSETTEGVSNPTSLMGPDDTEWI